MGGGRDRGRGKSLVSVQVSGRGRAGKPEGSRLPRTYLQGLQKHLLQHLDTRKEKQQLSLGLHVNSSWVVSMEFCPLSLHPWAVAYFLTLSIHRPRFSLTPLSSSHLFLCSLCCCCFKQKFQ